MISYGQVVIYGADNSYAIQYAKKHNISYVIDESVDMVGKSTSKSSANSPTSVNIKNKKTYKKSKKVTVKDKDGIKKIKLNNKKISFKSGKKSISFKLSKYKKHLKKKGKWNKLVITDMKGKKKTIKFKIK